VTPRSNTSNKNNNNNNNNNKKSGIQLRQTRGQWHKERRTLLSK